MPRVNAVRGRARERPDAPTSRRPRAVGEWIARQHGARADSSAGCQRAIATGTLPPPAASLLRLLHAESAHLSDDLARPDRRRRGRDRAGDDQGVAGRVGIAYLMRQSSSLGGGSSEMSRNIISERLLGMPRESAADRDIPFNQVKRGRV